ncbi:MAG TPA: TonB-dependent receptor [Steroidobacteraceae bacterium]|nr:TonB-dependent receptor [Steroidobacteraceae bacterium]
MSRKTRRNASNNVTQNLTLRAAIRRISCARLGLSGLALGSMAFSGQLCAAPADNPSTDSDLTEIVVTGIRASLQKSLDIKKESDGIVDAISAEDIGKFPDSNLAAAMERVPGVTVTRAASTLTGTGQTSTTGDPTQITVRGFGPQFNETLFDGRQVPTALGNTTRGFDFGSIGSEFVSQVDVLKTPDASLSAGAIGATINIKYPKPFDHPGLQVAGSLSGTDSTGDNKVTPNGSLLFSDTFADDRLGILVDAGYADTKVRANHINIQGWEGGNPASGGGLLPCQLKGAAPCAVAPGSATSPAPTINDWFIQDYGIYQEHNDDQRVGGRFVLQARPVDGLEITLDDNYAKETLVQLQQGFSAWFNNTGLTNVVQAPDGTVTSFTQPGTPTDFQAQLNQSVTETNTTGFNVKWDASAHTSYMFDAYHAVAKLNPGGQTTLDADVGYGNGPNSTSLGIVVPGGGNNLPYPVGFGPGGNAANFANPAYIGSHVLVESYSQNTDTINQLKLEGSWHDDQLKFKYGVQFTHDEEALRSFTDLPYTWQMYAGYGPPPVGSGGVAPIPASLISSTFSTGSNFINGWGNGALLPPNIIAANGYAILNYLQGLNGAGQNQNNLNTVPPTVVCTNLQGPTPCTGKYIMYQNLGNSQDITESTVSPYFSMSLNEKIEDMPLKINLGARLESTHVISAGLASLPVGQLTVVPTDHTSYSFNSTAAVPISTESNYRYLLPNLDLSLFVIDSLKVRFDASRTLTRAPLSDITPDLNVPPGQRVGALSATGGNPTLLPYLSDNLDIGAEWYYAQNSYVSADAFVKEVTNFVVGGTISQQINGVTLPSGAPAIFSITSQVNGPSAEVRGIELAWQYTIGDTGFGFQSNATFVGTNKPYDPNNLSQSGFAVTGLANSYNFVPFYDKYGFQARVAINHQASFLNNFGQIQNGSGFGIEPTFVNATTYVDFSTSYQINRHLNVYFTALNLTDQVYSTHGRFSEQVLDVVDTGRQFTLGIHAKL